ncbi:aldehyde dehydrogenase family 3 member B1-like isoform X1 [Carettochelys insculpta]|uniref:aldehyde dehydrogenase family 3 member B1-like isoform X1 n=2 Tax=Carettochelys insculpta TaxID=44489 RepID=UPI003EC0641F
MNPYAGVVSSLRTAWLAGKTRGAEHRVSQLEALGRFLEEQRGPILEAMALDMRKPPLEAELSEILLVRNEVTHALNSLSSWMKDEFVEKNLVTQLDEAFIRKEPYGVVLIIGPWNYPLHLILVPLVGAIAAGNCVLVKPSEISRGTEKLVAETLPGYLDKDCFAVVTGGPVETTQLLENKFDFIFFTGSPQVGRGVMAAAAQHLTPLALELGGKNPCYVAEDSELESAATRLVWGRCFNAGQTCVAPDYVLCSPATQEKLLPALGRAIARFFGPEPRESPDLARMVSDRHFRRVRALLGSGRVALGGQTDEAERYIAPTVLADVQPSQPAMQEEIFGPVLPIITVPSVDDAIAFINSRERPLAVYVFASDSKVVQRVLERTSSGGFGANDTLMQMTLLSLPFGGIGSSGLGSYHGRFSFDTFSHRRACLLRRTGLEALNSVRYPPYSERKMGLLASASQVKRKGGCSLQ